MMIQTVLTFSDSIHHLHGTADGLWIGHDGGVTFFDARHGSCAKWTTREGLPALPVHHVLTSGGRIALGTPNGVAWHDDVRTLERDALAGRLGRWERSLAHALGSGAYVNGVGFVEGKIYAATGGGRIYRERDRGFELVELPLRQARLVRLVALAGPKNAFRLFVTTNNSGALLLATGANEEPSLYQWSEDEGLCSRYVTAMAIAGEYVVVAVHGCLHVAPERTLAHEPERVSRWGRVLLADLPAPAEHSRIPALCEHEGALYAGTSAGLYRIPLETLASASREAAVAERIDDTPVRHLASCQGDLWVVQAGGLGRFLDAAPSGLRAEPSEPETRGASLRSRLFRGRFGGRAPESEPVFPPPSPSVRRWRFAPDARWRGGVVETECRHVLALATFPDGLALGGEGGRVVMQHGDRWSTESVARLRRPPEVHSLVFDPEDACFWAATRYGLYQRDARGRWHRDLEFPGRTVHALAWWGGSVVAVGSAGLHLFVQNEWTEVPFQEERPALFSVAARDGALALAARPGSGFYLWRSGEPHPHLASIAAGRANCMAWGRGGELWLGADRGLVRWDGSRTVSLAWNDERRDHVTALLVSGERLYVGSQAGLWVAPVAKLDAAASGESLEALGERLGLLQGLPDPNVTCLAAAPEGVWVGTQVGLALVT